MFKSMGTVEEGDKLQSCGNKIDFMFPCVFQIRTLFLLDVPWKLLTVLIWRALFETSLFSEWSGYPHTAHLNRYLTGDYKPLPGHSHKTKIVIVGK